MHTWREDIGWSPVEIAVSHVEGEMKMKMKISWVSTRDHPSDWSLSFRTLSSANRNQSLHRHQLCFWFFLFCVLSSLQILFALSIKLQFRFHRGSKTCLKLPSMLLSVFPFFFLLLLFYFPFVCFSINPILNMKSIIFFLYANTLL